MKLPTFEPAISWSQILPQLRMLTNAVNDLIARVEALESAKQINPEKDAQIAAYWEQLNDGDRFRNEALIRKHFSQK